MKRFFIDANVMLDALLKRNDHEPEEAGLLLRAGAQGRVQLHTTALSIGIVLYHLQRSDGSKRGPRLKQVKDILLALLDCVVVAPIDAEHFRQSTASSFSDIEDGAQYFAVATTTNLDGVVSRDPDYDGHIAVPRLSAAQAMKQVK